jgi:hypothetical protein
MRQTESRPDLTLSTTSSFVTEFFEQTLATLGSNRRAQERERDAAGVAPRDEAERKAVADAQKIVAIWNARQAGGRELWFYPTIGAAIAAGLPRLTYSCPACQQVGSIDLRTLDRHPGASIPQRRSTSAPLSSPQLPAEPVVEANSSDVVRVPVVDRYDI